MSKWRLKKDIIKNPCQKYSYTEYMKALDNVFYSVFFQDVELRKILWDSYRMALWNIALYAIEHHIDEIQHIQSIQNILLTIPGCKMRRLRYKKQLGYNERHR